MRLSLLGFVLLAGIAFAGCGGGGSGGGGGGSSTTTSNAGGVGGVTSSTNAISKVAVAPASPSLTVGQTLDVSVLGTDANGNVVATNVSNWSWTSSDTSVASFVQTGDHILVTANKAGSATLTATDSSSKNAGTTVVTVTNAPSGGGGGGGTAGTTVVYNNDFSSGAGTEWSPRTIEATPGSAKRASTSFLGEFGPQKVSLSLSALPTHGTMTVTFDLFIIRTMDGSISALPALGPDIWNLSVAGGATLLNTTFSNITSVLSPSGFPLGFFQAYPGSYPGPVVPYQTGAAEVNTLGFTAGGYPSDSVYHITRTFPHTATSVELDFTSQQTQVITDESWGLKNVVVTVTP